jgi:uncharacterized integral membrane protein
MAMADQDPLDKPAGQDAGKRKREQTRLIIGAILGIVVLIFVLNNTQRVKIHWIFGTTRTPVILALVITLLVGIIIGAVGARYERRSKKS